MEKGIDIHINGGGCQTRQGCTCKHLACDLWTGLAFCFIRNLFWIPWCNITTEGKSATLLFSFLKEMLSWLSPSLILWVKWTNFKVRDSFTLKKLKGITKICLIKYEYFCWTLTVFKFLTHLPLTPVTLKKQPLLVFKDFRVPSVDEDFL